MTFTCEEVWKYLPKIEAREESVHLALFPNTKNILGANVAEHDDANEKDWQSLRSIRDEVLKALEEARNAKLIGTGLEAQVHLTAPDPLYATLKRHEAQLRYLFIVSAVEIRPAASSDGAAGGVKVEIKKADGQKCDRCWNYSTHVGEDQTYPTVCERCSAVLKEI